MIGCNAASKVR